MTWQKCPVCEGRGTVSPGFYSGSPVATGTSTAREECRSCHGKGVLLNPIGGYVGPTWTWGRENTVDWAAQKRAPGLSV